MFPLQFRYTNSHLRIVLVLVPNRRFLRFLALSLRYINIFNTKRFLRVALKQCRIGLLHLDRLL